MMGVVFEILRFRASGGRLSAEELRAFLARHFQKFWLPDLFEFVDAIPRTSAGKFQKLALRERFKAVEVP